ncbi:MAG TPA: DNA alkylation repair protein [Nitrospirota bacterium]|nr:DNA alkylation repair protein [Nitrospirota bacterium]
MNARDIKKRLRLLADKEKARVLRGFFKTGPGQYGEGDLFLGITVPALRRLAKQCRDTSIAEAARLLASPVHEERLLALLLLVRIFEAGDEAAKKKICGFYLRNTRYVNNWDLVDLSAPNIVGNYLLDKSRKPLYAFAKSRDLWKRRIAIMATFAFIKEHDYADTLRISGLLLNDEHDLIHKAVGWMLREVGKRALSAEETFLKKHYKTMPRTMLRYAIERFPGGKRRKYLVGKI